MRWKAPYRYHPEIFTPSSRAQARDLPRPTQVFPKPFPRRCHSAAILLPYSYHTIKYGYTMATVWVEYGYSLPTPWVELVMWLLSNKPFLCKRYAFSLSEKSRFSQKGNTYCLNHSIFKLSELSIVEAFMHPTVSVSESQLFYKAPPFRTSTLQRGHPCQSQTGQTRFSSPKT